MNTNGNYSHFIEHSFRRLSLLIQQQDVLPRTGKDSMNQVIERPSSTSLATSNRRNNSPCHENPSHSSEVHCPIRSMNVNVADRNGERGKFQRMPRTSRIFMRPPKTRTSLPYRCSSSKLPEQSEVPCNQSASSSCSSASAEQGPNELPVYLPSERSIYDVKFEKDRQSDLHEKYNIPPPFQRTWLRQPRYVPQERPNFGQVQQSTDR